MRRKLLSFVLQHSEPMMWGGELLLRDGSGTGQVTSAAYATTTGACVGLAYVWRADGENVTKDYLESGDWSINVSGRIVPARVQLGALYDPASARIRT